MEDKLLIAITTLAIRLEEVTVINKGGLDIIQWLISIGFGSTCLIVGFILKFIDEDKICP